MNAALLCSASASSVQGTEQCYMASVTTLSWFHTSDEINLANCMSYMHLPWQITSYLHLSSRHEKLSCLLPWRTFLAQGITSSHLGSLLPDHPNLKRGETNYQQEVCGAQFTRTPFQHCFSRKLMTNFSYDHRKLLGRSQLYRGLTGLSGIT